MFAVTAASTTAIMIEMAGQERLVEACFEKNSAFDHSKSRSSTRAPHCPTLPRVGSDQCALTSIHFRTYRSTYSTAMTTAHKFTVHAKAECSPMAGGTESIKGVRMRPVNQASL